MITLDRVGYSFGTTEVFSDVSVSVPEGSFHFLTGASGAGKTTFLRLCYLDLLPTSGSMSIHGEQTAGLDRDAIAQARRKIGVVHQDCQFLDHLNVADNVALPLVVAGRDTEAHRSELEDLLKWVGLWPRKDAKPTELSGGERQRAALARAVILSPDLIIADEPTGNVDWDMGQRVMTLLCELNRMGKTILIATHDVNLIRSVGSSVSARLLRISNRGLTTAGSAL